MSQPDPQAKTTTMTLPASEVAFVEPSLNGFADRAALLALGGELEEDTVVIERKGKPSISLLIRELTGDERADLITKQADAYQNGKVEIKAYQQDLMVAGIADPSSPEGARLPLLKAGDAAAIMKLGGSKVKVICDAIQNLSGMSPEAQTDAEGNSASTPSGDSTSG